MDFSSLREQVSNLTMYDLKAGVRKVQNGTLRPLLCPRQVRDSWRRALLPGGLTSYFLRCSCYELHGNGGQGPLEVYPVASRIVSLT